MGSSKKRGSHSSADSYSDIGSVYSSEATMSFYAPSSITSQGSTSMTMYGHGLGYAQQRLPCEFNGYSGCDLTFGLDDPESWVEHIVTAHLRDQLPKKVICWFCDDYVFSYKDKSARGDLRINFENRMYHIRDHILNEGMTISQMRPDHHMNTHLNNAKLITEDTYNGVRRYSEVAGGPWLYSHDAVPFEIQRKTERNQYLYTNSQDEDRRRKRDRPRR